uniref:NADH-ubiquinone oxidoreductase chain 2 n=1 Tax=Agonoscena pistaciae TaxID=1635299 RepID=A0A8F2Q0I3_9HEMI|nr:NADH dehydrogenase subunit 2 [Agonoscena pistaciae]
MKSFNFILLPPVYLLSIILPMSFSSWLTMWAGLEINMFLFILTMTHSPSVFANEMKMKYFLVQSFSSLIFLLTMNINFHSFEETALLNKIVPSLAILLKMGASPLHSWAPQIACKLPQESLMMFLTLQKIPPLFIINSFNWSGLIWVSLINMIVGTIMGISESNTIKILIFSSINNIGWMLICMLMSLSIFILFFTIYFTLTSLAITFLKSMKTKWISQIKSPQKMEKIVFYSNMMSLGGLPPLLGFAPKWIIISKMIYFNILVTSIIVVTSIPLLFFYIKMSINLIMCFSMEKKWMNKSFSMNIWLNSMSFVNLMGMPLFFTLT